MTAAISAMAIFVTIAIKAGRTSIDPFVMSSLAFESEPWRLASSALPHGDWVHLIFNVIWTWVLGTRLEETLGHVSTFAIIVVLAVGSEAAEFALAVGGIGLSGVGYGLVGCLWMLRTRDPRFRDAIDRNVVITFLAWGLLCVALTLADVWAIGNIAHGVGLVIGALLGLAIAPGRPARRLASAVGATVVVAGFVVAAGWLRPQVNLSSRVAIDDGYAGSEALGDKQYDLAARHLRRAVELDPGYAAGWYNYGIALQHVTDPGGVTALDAWRRAVALAPDDERFKLALAGEYTREGIEAHERGDLTQARDLYGHALAVAETATAHWNLGLVQRALGDEAAASASLARARELEPAIGHSDGSSSTDGSAD